MVLDLVDGHEVFKVDVSYPVHELVLTEDGRELLTLPGVGRFDRQCRRRAQLWQLRPGRLRAEFDGCPSVAVMESGQVVTYSLDDRRIRVWNQRGALEGLSDTMPAVSALALTRDRSRLAVGSPAGVDIVDMKTLRRLITIAITPSPLPGASFGPTHLRYTPDDSQLVILHGDLIRVLNAVRSRRADVRVTVRSVLSGETFDLRRPSRQWNDELIQRIAAAQNMDRQIQEAVIAELRRMGDRDPIALCNDSRQVGVRTDAKPEEYQRALRNALRTYELAPWSADCLGVLGIARYRVQDYVGALDAFERARQIRWDYDYRSVELAFKAMTLQRLDRRVEAAAVAGQARAGGAVELTEDVKNAIKELATIVPTAGSSR